MQRCRRDVVPAPPPRACSVPFLSLSLSLSLYTYILFLFSLNSSLACNSGR